jgi:tetratricopeptide (TPR) repeat protein
MLTDNQVLEAFGEHLSPIDTASSVARFLRTPPIWRALHRPDVLQRCLACEDPSRLAPGDILTAAVHAAPPEPAVLAAVLDGTWDGSGEVELEAISTRAHALVWASHQPETPSWPGLAMRPQWRDALACAWPDMQGRDQILREGIAASDSSRLGALANAMLSNLSLSEAATQLASALGEHCVQAVAALHQIEEHELAVALTERVERASAAEIGEPKLAGHLPSDTAGSTPDGDLGSRFLQDAWHQTQAKSAIVADQLADLAEARQEWTLALAARQQAYATAPSPDRGASLAMAYLALDNVEGALDCLPDDAGGLAGQIASAAAMLYQGMSQKAQALLEALRISDQELVTLPARWLEHALNVSQQAALRGLTLQFAKERTRRLPGSPDAWLQRARAELDGGAFQQATESASLAHSLAPESLEARLALARTWMAVGKPEKALRHWEVLAAQDPEKVGSHADCALRAGQPELAKALAERMLEEGAPVIEAQVILARASAAMGDPDSARRMIHQVIALEPALPDAWHALAELQVLQGESTLAIATLESAVQAAPYAPDLFMALARSYAQEGRFTEAVDVSARALELDPAQGEVLAARGAWLLALGRLDEAMTDLQAAKRSLPSRETIDVLQAKVLEERGDVAEALRVLDQVRPDLLQDELVLYARLAAKHAVASGDETYVANAARQIEACVAPLESPDAALWAGRALLLAGNAIGAVQYLVSALGKSTEASPQNRLELAIDLAEACLQAEQPKVAIQPLEDLESTCNEDASLWIALTRLYEADGQIDSALQSAWTATKVAPRAPLAWRTLGRITKNNGDMNTALKAEKQWAELSGDQVEPWLTLASTASNHPDPSHRRLAIAHAARIARSDPSQLRTVAEAASAMGEAQLARLAMRKAHRLQPEDESTARALADLCALTGDAEGAVEAWQSLESLLPDDPEVLAGAARALKRLGKGQEVLERLQRASVSAPDVALYRLELAEALMAEGHLTEALDTYAAAVEAFPADEVVRVKAGLARKDLGDWRGALPLLEEALQRWPGSTTVRLALAEVHLAADQPRLALQVSGEITRNQDADIAVGSLRAIAHARLGELAEATHEFSLAVLPQDASPEDRVWISRAARELGEWAHVLRPDTLPASSPLPAVVEALHGLVRLADAAWLYGAASAHRHAPPQSWIDAEAWTAWTALEQSIGMQEQTPGSTPCLRLRADIHRRANDSETRERLAQSCSSDPTGAARDTLAIAYLRAGLAGEAVACLSDPSKTETPWTDLLLGLGHAGKGSPALALDSFETASSDPTLVPLATFLRGRTRRLLGQPEQASSDFSQAATCWPDEPAWQYELATTYVDTHSPERAVPHLQQAVALQPESHEYRLAYAEALADSGMARQAVEQFLQVIDEVPAVGRVWKVAAEAALEARDMPQAIAWYEQACRLMPDDVECRLGAARACMATGNSGRAEEHLAIAARQAPKDSGVNLTLGEIYATQGKFEKAILAFDRARTEAADPIPARLGRAEVLLKIGRSEEAVRDLEEILAGDPEDETLWLALARAHEAAGDLSSALDAAQRAHELSPRTTPPAVTLGRLARASGNLDRAIDVLARQQQTAPDDAQTAFELGCAYEERREYKRSLEQLEAAIAHDPSCAPAYFHAGKVFRAIKDYPQAGRMLERAVELDPKNAEALHQLAAVRALELVHGAIPLQAVQL